MNRYQDREYEVGKGKPPKSGQIQPGEVRNRGGRGRVRDRATVYNEKADAPVELGGKSKGKKSTRRDLAYEQTLSGAAQGNPKMLAYFLKLESELAPQISDGTLIPDQDLDEIVDSLLRHYNSEGHQHGQ